MTARPTIICIARVPRIICSSWYTRKAIIPMSRPSCHRSWPTISPIFCSLGGCIADRVRNVDSAPCFFDVVSPDNVSAAEYGGHGDGKTPLEPVVRGGMEDLSDERFT